MLTCITFGFLLKNSNNMQSNTDYFDCSKRKNIIFKPLFLIFYLLTVNVFSIIIFVISFKSTPLKNENVISNNYIIISKAFSYDPGLLSDIILLISDCCNSKELINSSTSSYDFIFIDSMTS